jgi:hypothetical protein
MVEKFMVEKFMVEKFRIEKFRVRFFGLKCLATFFEMFNQIILVDETFSTFVTF